MSNYGIKYFTHCMCEIYLYILKKCILIEVWFIYKHEHLTQTNNQFHANWSCFIPLVLSFRQGIQCFPVSDKTKLHCKFYTHLSTKVKSQIEVIPICTGNVNVKLQKKNQIVLSIYHCKLCTKVVHLSKFLPDQTVTNTKLLLNTQ